MTTLLIVLIAFAISLALALALTPLAGRLAVRCGLVDRPDGRRKMHAHPIPLGGGPVLLLAAVAAVAAVLAFPSEVQTQLEPRNWKGLTGLALGALVISAVGVADDYGYLRGRHKLLGQVLAATIVMAFGLVIRRIDIFRWEIELGLLAVPFTLFWLIGAMNALNLLDGMDGLLSTVGLIVVGAVAVMAGYQERWDVACVATALAGALLGFLRYNFPPARIFLGDSGSMLIGLVVGALALESSLKTQTAAVALAVPTALLAIPIFDTVAAIIRRKLTGRSIYTTDRGHLHHCLLGRGLSTRRVLLCIAAFCLVTVGGVIVSLELESEIYAIVTAAALIGVLIASRVFGYAEFLLVKQSLRVGLSSLWSNGPSNGKCHQLQIRLQGSADWGELWDAITSCAEELNLRAVCLDVNAPSLQEGYHARWGRLDDDEENPTLWRAEIPVGAEGRPVGRLLVVGPCGVESVYAKIAQVEKLVQRFGTRPAELNGRHHSPVPAPHGPHPPVHAPPETAPLSATPIE